MPYTYEQQAEYQRLFALKRRRQLILSIPLLGVVLAGLALRDRGGRIPFDLPVALVGPVFLLLIVGALLFSFWNWRCPACEKYLGKSLSPRFCPKCGVALQTGR
ncbi:MAG TPA: hypothetical protein VGR38_12815 [Candidatus Polarisedimenticolia bacterium]|nr:hypothetical protein [Candidatus Polarisedimenticolia bacterium]